MQKPELDNPKKRLDMFFNLPLFLGPYYIKQEQETFLVDVPLGKIYFIFYGIVVVLIVLAVGF